MEATMNATQTLIDQYINGNRTADPLKIWYIKTATGLAKNQCFDEAET
jgi:hypothetical protein